MIERKESRCSRKPEKLKWLEIFKARISFYSKYFAHCKYFLPLKVQGQVLPQKPQLAGYNHQEQQKLLLPLQPPQPKRRVFWAAFWDKYVLISSQKISINEHKKDEIKQIRHLFFLMYFLNPGTFLCPTTILLTDQIQKNCENFDSKFGYLINWTNHF